MSCIAVLLVALQHCLKALIQKGIRLTGSYLHKEFFAVSRHCRHNQRPHQVVGVHTGISHTRNALGFQLFCLLHILLKVHRGFFDQLGIVPHTLGGVHQRYSVNTAVIRGNDLLIDPILDQGIGAVNRSVLQEIGQVVKHTALLHLLVGNAVTGNPDDVGRRFSCQPRGRILGIDLRAHNQGHFNAGGLFKGGDHIGPGLTVGTGFIGKHLHFQCAGELQFFHLLGTGCAQSGTQRLFV